MLPFPLTDIDMRRTNKRDSRQKGCSVLKRRKTGRNVPLDVHKRANMPGPAGVAFDGSVWVTATSSVAMVVGTVGLVVAAGNLAARRVADGTLALPSMTAKDAREGMVVGASSSRSKPLRKVEGAGRVDVADKGTSSADDA